jgi:hypothetical protein
MVLPRAHRAVLSHRGTVQDPLTYLPAPGGGTEAEGGDYCQGAEDGREEGFETVFEWRGSETAHYLEDGGGTIVGADCARG